MMPIVRCLPMLWLQCREWSTVDNSVTLHFQTLDTLILYGISLGPETGAQRRLLKSCHVLLYGSMAITPVLHSTRILWICQNGNW